MSPHLATFNLLHLSHFQPPSAKPYSLISATFNLLHFSHLQPPSSKPSSLISATFNILHLSHLSPSQPPSTSLISETMQESIAINLELRIRTQNDLFDLIHSYIFYNNTIQYNSVQFMIAFCYVSGWSRRHPLTWRSNKTAVMGA